MPSFNGGGLGTSFGKTVDKANNQVAFNEESHTYWDLLSGEQYISVTTLVGKYEQPYDAQFWARYKVCEILLDPDDWEQLKPVLLRTKRWKDAILDLYGIDKDFFAEKVEEKLAEYEANKQEACEHGTAVHLAQELAFYKDADKEVQKFGKGGHFDCKPGYYKLDLQRGCYPEILVNYDFDGLKISGQIDLLIVDGLDIILCDHKTNREIKKHSFFDKTTKKHVMMKYPLNNLEDCAY